MLAVFVLASLVVPGVVAARQQASAETSSAARADLDEVAAEAELLVEAAPVGPTCFNRTCTTHAQCRTWCDEPSAQCAPVALPPHYKFCHLP
jgi:hypothetical protein